MTDFSLALAQSLLNETELFPVNFDDAWQWLGYSTKQKGLDMLQSNFVTPDDYFNHPVELGSSASPRPSHKYSISVECFKLMGMLAGTVKGKEIRRYFLECEKIAKSVKVEAKPLTEIEVARKYLASLEAIEKLEVQKQELLRYADLLARYASIIRASKHNNVHESTFSWHALKKANKELGLEVKESPCPRFGKKNLYDVQAFKHLYPALNFDFTNDFTE